MNVVAHLSPVLLMQLRVALGREHALRAASSWRELHALLAQAPPDVLVVEPTVAGGEPADLLAVAARHPGVPVVVYTPLSPPGLRAVVALARHGLTQVVLHRFDDEPRRFRELLEQQAGATLAERLLETLEPALARLTPPLAAAVRQLFRQPQLAWSAQALATSAGLPRRTLYRQLEAAGFASPRRLVQAARLLRAYGYLRDPGVLVEDVAARLHYGSPHLLARHTRETVGLTPSALRRGVEGPELVELLARHLLAG